MKKVEVWLYETSEPLVYNAKSTYTKGPLYCVYCEDGKVVKFPVEHIFRIIEDYGTHGGTSTKEGTIKDVLDSCDCNFELYFNGEKVNRGIR